MIIYYKWCGLVLTFPVVDQPLHLFILRLDILLDVLRKLFEVFDEVLVLLLFLLSFIDKCKYWELMLTAGPRKDTDPTIGLFWE